MSARANGFRIRGCNPDCDRLAVQSSEQTTWQLGYAARAWLGSSKWHDVGLLQNELMVLRAYGGAPVFEVQALGDKAGCLVIEPARSRARVLRVGARTRIELGQDESCVVRCEWISHPMHAGVAAGAYGRGVQV